MDFATTLLPTGCLPLLLALEQAAILPFLSSSVLPPSPSPPRMDSRLLVARFPSPRVERMASGSPWLSKRTG